MVCVPYIFSPQHVPLPISEVLEKIFSSFFLVNYGYMFIGTFRHDLTPAPKYFTGLCLSILSDVNLVYVCLCTECKCCIVIIGTRILIPTDKFI